MPWEAADGAQFHRLHISDAHPLPERRSLHVARWRSHLTPGQNVESYTGASVDSLVCSPAEGEYSAR